MPNTITAIGIGGLPEIGPGAPLGDLLQQACRTQGTPIQQDDVIVVTQKIVSKAEGRVVDLSTVFPSKEAMSFANAWEKDARVVELALRESVRVLRMEAGVLITETKHGFVCANSGVDSSNAGDSTRELAVLLPADPDASAAQIRDRIAAVTGSTVGVIISDTFGRPWREGAIDVAIGVAGIDPIVDYRGAADTDGRLMHSTTIAIVDEIAAAAEMVTRKVDQVPAAIVRGLSYTDGKIGIKSMIRSHEKDLCR